MKVLIWFKIRCVLPPSTQSSASRGREQKAGQTRQTPALTTPLAKRLCPDLPSYSPGYFPQSQHTSQSPHRDCPLVFCEKYWVLKYLMTILNLHLAIYLPKQITHWDSSTWRSWIVRLRLELTTTTTTLPSLCPTGLLLSWPFWEQGVRCWVLMLLSARLPMSTVGGNVWNTKKHGGWLAFMPWEYLTLL